MFVKVKKKAKVKRREMSYRVGSRQSITEMLTKAIQLHQAGDLAKADSLYHQILMAEPEHSDALHLAGVLAYQSGDNVRAAEFIRKSISINHDVSYYHNNLGNALLNLGNEDEAAQCYKEAIRLMPDNAEAHNNLGNVLKNRGKVSEALQQYEKAIHIDPGHDAALNNMANLLKHNWKLDEAINIYIKALELKPYSAEMHFNLGSAFEEAGRLEESAHHFRTAIKINPDFAEAYNDLGNVLKKQQKYEESLIQYRKAIKLNPDFAVAYSNLGDTYRLQGEFGEAIENCQKALKLKSDFALALVSLGNVFLDRGDYNEAVEQYQRAIDLEPGMADAHYNKGIVLLMKGEFDQGWREYEWRFKSREISRDIGYTKSKIPEWDGSPLNGKTILVISEQGFGDHIQFARYLPMVKERGGRVVFESRQALMRLFEGYEGIDEIVDESSNDKSSTSPDVCVQLMSLPRIFGTTPETVPDVVPYLQVDSDSKDKWKSYFNRNLFNVGIVWSGSKAHRNDRNRSCVPSDFAPLAAVPGIALYSLQKEGMSEDITKLPESMEIKDIGKNLDDFYDTAAVIENIDLVISVDTAVAHLAGALGKTVWTLLPFVPDWRWLIERSDTPWYPTMRLFRQPVPRDWKSVLKKVTAELEKNVLLKGAINE